MRENFLRRSHFDQAAGVHDTDSVRHLRYYREVVGDKKHGKREFLAKLAQQIKNLRLDGDVERSRRLIGDEQRRPVHHRHGNHYALTLSARELVRIVTRALVGVGNGNGA